MHRVPRFFQRVSSVGCVAWTGTACSGQTTSRSAGHWTLSTWPQLSAILLARTQSESVSSSDGFGWKTVTYRWVCRLLFLTANWWEYSCAHPLTVIYSLSGMILCCSQITHRWDNLPLTTAVAWDLNTFAAYGTEWREQLLLFEVVCLNFPSVLSSSSWNERSVQWLIENSVVWSLGGAFCELLSRPGWFDRVH